MSTIAIYSSTVFGYWKVYSYCKGVFGGLFGLIGHFKLYLSALLGIFLHFSTGSRGLTTTKYRKGKEAYLKIGVAIALRLRSVTVHEILMSHDNSSVEAF